MSTVVEDAISTSASLDADEFDQFFFDVNGFRPFRWQRRLLKQVLESGWPSAINLKTGSGKSAVVEAAIFHLALEAGLPLSERKAPMRVVNIVDVRTVVDESFERAMRLAEKLRDPKTDVLRRVANRLSSLSGGIPLTTTIMRGQVYRENMWCINPAQPAVIAATVDQSGSRLLFRGYDVSDTSRPIHAALLAEDALLIIDEAHIAVPFVQTICAVSKFKNSINSSGFRTPSRVVLMSATLLPHTASDVFAFDADDRGDSDLAPRLLPKRIELRPVGSAVLRQMADDVVSLISSEHPRPPVVSVVCNQVGYARSVFSQLHRHKKSLYDVILLTGRTRQSERTLILAKWHEYLRSFGDRSTMSRPLVVVSTQCIEVGADFDFDYMLTEIASLSTLVQRFGRMNRLGNHTDSATTSRGFVYWQGREEKTESGGTILVPEADPIYGSSGVATARYLLSRATNSVVLFDENLQNSAPQETYPEKRDPATLTRALLDLLVQTRPVPFASPSVDVFLRGKRTDYDVGVVWRSDLDPTDQSKWCNVVLQVPPTVSEALALPIYNARVFLRRASAAKIADVDTSSEELELHTTSKAVFLPFALYRSKRDITVTDDISRIQVGDVLIVPSSYGGCDEYGVNFDQFKNKRQVFTHDIAEIGAWASHRRVYLRFNNDSNNSFFKSIDNDEIQFVFRRLSLASRFDDTVDALIRRLFDLLSGQRLDPWQQEVLDCLSPANREVTIHASGRGIVIRSKTARGRVISEEEDDDDTSASDREITVDNHSRSVGECVRQFATAIGIQEPLLGDLVTAGYLHDIGKFDPRFSAWLRGCTVEELGDTAPLAKSPSVGNPNRRRDLSQYPRRYRHEALSGALILSSENWAQQVNDLDLVLHLVMSHHGYCRPRLPIAEEFSPGECSVSFLDVEMSSPLEHNLDAIDSGVVDRFARLNRKYGYWGLAYLETIIRLADWNVSRSED